jgi:hypothetical protein
MSPRFLVPSCNITVNPQAQSSNFGVEVGGESIAADLPAQNPSKEMKLITKRAVKSPPPLLAIYDNTGPLGGVDDTVVRNFQRS